MTPEMVAKKTDGQLVDRLYKAKLKIAEIEKKKAPFKEEKDLIEAELMQRMEAAGTTMLRGTIASTSYSKTIVPQLKDYEAFTKYVGRTKNFQLFNRALNAKAFRELLEKRRGQGVPGLEPFEKKSMTSSKVDKK